MNLLDCATSIWLFTPPPSQARICIFDKMKNILVSSILLFILNEKIIMGALECEESRATAENVFSCPRTVEDWKAAVLRKNCSQIKHNCLSFEYHCVINTWLNATVEVCAPEENIVGNGCAEYNDGGNRIQRHSKQGCELCPVVYKSVDSYKYHECFVYDERLRDTTISSTLKPTKSPFQTKRNDTIGSSIKITDDAAIKYSLVGGSFIIALIIAIIIGILRWARKRKDGNHTIGNVEENQDGMSFTEGVHESSIDSATEPLDSGSHDCCTKL